MPSPIGLGSPGTTPAMMPVHPPDTFARDAIIAWFRGEFAAANAIIDSLCSHLRQLEGGGGSDYESVFAAIHRRRMNWIPILQMQKYHPIADVAIELKRVTEKKMMDGKGEFDGSVKVCFDDEKENRIEKVVIIDEKVVETEGNGGGNMIEEDESLDSDVTDGGSQEARPTLENIQLCSNHEECETRPTQIKTTKGFVAREPVKGQMVNAVRGLKLYEDIFTDSELLKLTNFVNELRVAGRAGELPGETFKIFNKQMKGIKREMIQLGVPLFGQIKEETANNIEPIPPLLQNVIDHLVQWRLIPFRKPNSCIINYFDEGEYSQPHLKPPHLDQPIVTLLLSESTMAFGSILESDNDGNYKAPLSLSLKEGSLLVLRGNSAEIAAHVMCPSPIKRASITFFRVRENINQEQSLAICPSNGAMTVWQPGVQNPRTMQNGYEAMDLIPKWGVLRAPMVMLAPFRPMALNSGRFQRGGTGVFLPWTVGSRKHPKHLPPRAQKGRFLALPPPETHVAGPNSESGISIDGKIEV